MTKQQVRLTKAYQKYHKKKVGRKDLLSFLRSFLPEMILRTTRLEGEKVSRRVVSSIVK